MDNKPYYKFLGWLAENGIKHKTVAELIGVTVQTFSLKINRKGTDFTAEEVRLICQNYQLSADDYFFAKIVEK